MGDSAVQTLVNACAGPFGGIETLEGKTDVERKEIQEWIARYEKDLTGLPKALNERLETRTFLVGHVLTKADLWSFIKVHEHVSGMSEEAQLKRPHLARWFDLIQNLAGELGQLSPVDIRLEAPALDLSANSNNNKKAASPSPADEKKGRRAAKKEEKEAKKEEEKKAKKEKKAAAAGTDAAPEAAAAAPAAAAATSAEGANQGKKKEKKEKKEKAPKAPAAPAAPAVPQPWQVDLRVGKIVSVEKHPDADSLYVEKIDIGEAEPRTVVSGLVKHIPIEQMQDRWLVCVCNLKPATMRGVKSFAMVLAATDDSGKLELVEPPKGAKPGDKCYFGDWKTEQPDEVMNPKKKIWETIQPGLHTTQECRAAWQSPEGAVHVLRSEKGDCTVPSVVGAKIK
ncbi:G4 quadruplex nucleic acid binding protein [Actinomortierella ambigua]|nr:G4 quadruplex nucleic acid binding protein [Actinomortierella ambigua]